MRNRKVLTQRKENVDIFTKMNNDKKMKTGRFLLAMNTDPSTI